MHPTPDSASVRFACSINATVRDPNAYETSAARRLLDRRALRESLDQRSVRTLDFRDWLAFDAAEQQRGAAGGKPREKFTRIEEMLAAAG